MYITQIYISSDNSPLPPALEATTRLVRRLYPDANYRLYDAETLRAYIEAHFSPEVLQAYDRLKPYAFKADLGRMCLLYGRGGLYLDLPLQPVRPLFVGPEIKAILFRDFNLMLPSSWGVSNSFFYTLPRARFLATAIELAIARIKSGDYGVTPFSITGPGVFGQALAREGENENVIFGDRLPLTPLHPNKNFAFVMPDGSIAAWGKQAGNGGDLTPYGATATNNYMTMWKEGDVFENA